jgi:MYXO-CTERM domain-containing protein
MKTVACILVLALAAHLSPAHAGASGRATQGQLGYTLVDLDPGDGIAPSLVFASLPDPAPAGAPGAAHGGAYALLPSGTRYDERFGTGTAPIVLGHDLGAAGSVFARLDGRAQPGTHVLAIDASANGGSTGAVQVGAWLDTGGMAFTLSARTRVEFHTTFQVQAGVTAGPGADEWFQGASWMYLTMGSDPDTAGFDWDHALATAHADPGWGVPRTVDTTLVLSVASDNAGGASRYGTVSFSTWVGAVSAVPEPHALPMVLGGLLVLAARRRRMRRPALS